MWHFDRRLPKVLCGFMAVAFFVAWCETLAVANQDAAQESHSDETKTVQGTQKPSGPSFPSAVDAIEKETSWEYDPYRVLVWLVDDGSNILRGIGDRIDHRIERDALLEDYSGWTVKCERPDVIWNSRIESNWRSGLSSLTKTLAVDNALREQEKLIVIRLAKSPDGFTVESQSLDVPTRQWSAITKLSAAELDRVPAQAFAAMRQSFMPLVRIERVANETVYVRTRATELSRRMEVDEAGNWHEVPNDKSPIWLRDSDIFVPVIRRETRENRAASVEPITFTFLMIQERLGSTLKCFTHTAYPAPLSGRSGAQIKKLAIVVRPDRKSTLVSITAQEFKTPTPITGLDVYHIRPDELGIGTENYHLLGKTDWKGTITVPPADDSGIRYIIIRNGQLATKRPILPGLFETQTVAIPSDRARIFAEGVVESLRGQVIDLAVRRAALRHRIEIALQKEQFAKAEKLLNEEYLKLPSMRELNIRLAQAKERLMSRKDADLNQRRRIERMFDGLETGISQSLVDKHVTLLTQHVLNKISTPIEYPSDKDPLVEGVTQESPISPNKTGEQAPPQTPATEQQFD